MIHSVVVLPAKCTNLSYMTKTYLNECSMRFGPWDWVFGPTRTLIYYNYTSRQYYTAGMNVKADF